MIEQFLDALQKQKKENLHSLYKLFDNYLKIPDGLERNKLLLSTLTSEYIDLMIDYNDLDISVGNDNYNENRENGKNLRLYKFTNQIKWGKHSGKLFSELINGNERYILWAIINIENFIIENSFFLINYIRADTNYLKALEINLIKQYALEKYHESISYHDEETENDKWENSRFYDGFEGDIDTWNHYSQ